LKTQNALIWIRHHQICLFFLKTQNALIWTRQMLTAANIGVGAQLTLGEGGTTFLPEKNMYEKLSTYPNFYYICPKY